MKCPQCGNEVAGGKFCGSCGAPMETAAAIQPQPQPYPYQQPAPMPPQKKSLAWLWITLGIVGAVAVLGIAALFLLGGDDDLPGAPKPNPGPSAGPSTDPSPGPAATASSQETLTSYLQARKAGEMAAAFKLLSAKARETYTQAEFEAFYKDTKLVSFGNLELSQVSKPDAPLQIWLVHDVNNGTRTAPTIIYTVVQEGNGYRVALDNPLLDKVDAAFEAKNYAEALNLSNQMLAINPKSYWGLYNLGWAQMETGKFAEAAASFESAVNSATNQDRPDAFRSAGLAYLNLGDWKKGISNLQEARFMGEELGDVYDQAWFDTVDADMALGYEKSGRVKEAIDLLEPIYAADPESTLALSLAGRLERKPYEVADGWATYKLIKHGVSFALPEDWVVSNETTGGDWWFARHPDTTPATRIDFAVYIHGDYLGKSMDEAVAGVLKRYQEPIGAPKRDVSIVHQETVEVDGHQAVALGFSDRTISLLMQVGKSWIDFHWFANPVAQQAGDAWSETIQVTW